MVINDKLKRSFEYLRISLTDRCNYRCSYCMPKDIFNADYKYLKKSELLTFEEILSFIKALKAFDIKKIRLTGGEPLLRRNIENLINGIKDTGINEVALTTNGSLLSFNKAKLLKQNGLDSVTISLDSLRCSTNKKINPYSNLSKVIDSIYIATDVFGYAKINVVIMNNVNSNEIFDIVDKFKNFNVEIRFIEFMDVGETNEWNLDRVYSSERIHRDISKYFSLIKLTDDHSSTSTKWQLNGYNAKIGFISSITQPFCGSCNRARLSADGLFYTCLFASQGYNVLDTLRKSSDINKLQNDIENVWARRIDQYSVLRKSSRQDNEHKSKIEMSYIGG
tara:strand:- start:386 stop:1393 length:1008 start_codon:yes stop_codon:yes gene_type:complete